LCLNCCYTIFNIILKKLFILLITLSLIACKSEDKKEDNASSSTVSEGATANFTPEQQLGKEIFEGKGNCYSCHKPEEKAIGPAIREISKIYKAQKGDIVTFLKGEGKPIVDPSQFEVMKTNFYITKTFSEEELKAVEAYIYSY